MAVYNPNWTNVTNIYNLTKLANDTTSNVLIMGFLLAVFFVMLLTLYKFGFVNSLITTGWTVFLMGLFAWYAGMVSIYFLVVILIIAGVGTFLKVVLRTD